MVPSGSPILHALCHSLISYHRNPSTPDTRPLIGPHLPSAPLPDNPTPHHLRGGLSHIPECVLDLHTASETCFPQQAGDPLQPSPWCPFPPHFPYPQAQRWAGVPLLLVTLSLCHITVTLPSFLKGAGSCHHLQRCSPLGDGAQTPDFVITKNYTPHTLPSQRSSDTTCQPAGSVL